MSESVYSIGVAVIAILGWVGGGIAVSGLYHRGRLDDAVGWGTALMFVPIIVAGLWPGIIVGAPLVGLGYLAHKGIGRVVTKLEPPMPRTSFPDPDLTAATREVEEICSETHN